MFDSGATLSTFTLQEQKLLRVRDQDTIPCSSRIADSSKVAGKLIVLTAHLEGDTHDFRVPIVFLPMATQVLIGLVGIFNHYEIRHDPINWLTEFEWKGPQLPPKRPPPLPPFPAPAWSGYWESKVTEQMALGRSWPEWEANGRPDDWLDHWEKP